MDEAFAPPTTVCIKTAINSLREESRAAPVDGDLACDRCGSGGAIRVSAPVIVNGETGETKYMSLIPGMTVGELRKAFNQISREGGGVHPNDVLFNGRTVGELALAYIRCTHEQRVSRSTAGPATVSSSDPILLVTSVAIAAAAARKSVVEESVIKSERPRKVARVAAPLVSGAIALSSL